MNKVNKRKSDGFSLLETTVAMGIFTVVISVTIGAFLVAIKAQRVVLTEKAISENINFALEFMSRQMRVAKRDTAGACISTNSTFDTQGSQVSFINADLSCIRFFLSFGALTYENTTTFSGEIALTDNTVVSIDKLSFLVQGEQNSDLEQPRATVVISASGAGNSAESQGVQLNIQTTVSTRGLDIN